MNTRIVKLTKFKYFRNYKIILSLPKTWRCDYIFYTKNVIINMDGHWNGYSDDRYLMMLINNSFIKKKVTIMTHEAELLLFEFEDIILKNIEIFI